VDDTEERGAGREWVLHELTVGRDPEELLAQLTAAGWPQDDAAEMVEEARRATRHLRGVITRQDVVRGVDARYRRTMSRSPFLACFGIVGVAIHSCRSLLGYLIIRKPRPIESPSEKEA